MITVELKRGFGYLGAGRVSKKIGKVLAAKGVKADCYTDDGYVQVDVEGIAREDLANYICNIIGEKLYENGVQASCSAHAGTVQIDVQDITLTVLEKKVEETIRRKAGNSCWVEDVR